MIKSLLGEIGGKIVGHFFGTLGFRVQSLGLWSISELYYRDNGKRTWKLLVAGVRAVRVQGIGFGDSGLSCVRMSPKAPFG